MESALIAGIVFMIFTVICSSYLDSLKSSSGVILASEEVGLKNAPIIIGVIAFLAWLNFKYTSND